MKLPRCVISAAVGLAVWSTQVSVVATDIVTNITISSFNVGTLMATNRGVFTNGTRGGITVDAQFSGNYPPLRTNVEARWVQLISTSHPFNTTNAANTPYFDPGELDLTGDSDPFYWNTPLAGLDGTNYPGFWYKNYQFNSGQGITFFDQPKRNLSDAPVSWTAELNLVCWETGSKEFGVLWSGSYGFTIATNGAVNAFGFNVGSLGYLTQARLSAAFAGWTIVDAVTCIPEPGTMLLLPLAAIAFIVQRWWRRRSD